MMRRFARRARSPSRPAATAKLGLWRRIGRSNRLFPRKLKLTREGRLLIGITLGIGFAAINTGNNLMYLVLGMLLSLMIVSGILSELTLRNVEVQRVRRSPLVAGQEELVRVRLANRKRFFVSYSLEVEEVIDGIEEVPSYVLRMGPGEEADATIRMRAKRRGEYVSAGLLLATRFPFSFFRKSRFLPEPITFVVHPRAHPIRSPEQEVRREGSARDRPHIGRGDEVYGVREYRATDAQRDIHWKVSARRGRLMSREYERPGTRSIWLAYANLLANEEERERFEDEIEYVASLASHLIERGCSVGLVTHDGTVGSALGERQRECLLTHLAGLTGVLPGSLESPLRVPDDGAERILVVPRTGPPPTAEGIDRFLSVEEWPRVV